MKNSGWSYLGYSRFGRPCPSIPHKVSLETLRRRLNKRETSKIPNEDMVQMAEVALKNNFFEFSGELKRQNQVQQFAPPCACIFMDEVESKK